VNMGDHKVIARDKLPPQIVKAFTTMQPGQVSGLIQIETAYTIVRLNAHNPASKQSLQEVKADLKEEFAKEQVREATLGPRQAIACQSQNRSQLGQLGTLPFRTN